MLRDVLSESFQKTFEATLPRSIAGRVGVLYRYVVPSVKPHHELGNHVHLGAAVLLSRGQILVLAGVNATRTALVRLVSHSDRPS